jgi:hypothetical protein
VAALGGQPVILLAHAGHWAVDLLYAMPVILLVGLLIRDRIKHRGEEDVDAPQPDHDGRD